MHDVPFPETGSHRERKLWGKSRGNTGHVVSGKCGRWNNGPMPTSWSPNRDYVVLHGKEGLKLLSSSP